ncbi:DapH/DapD/GlmU-related protein [Agrilactobacillus fermenti]|uniref:DapH/DapD/GlmU-related protein n=1 Tax=Agrilactobacillus fermenti TaxID=2586909 RepID=UPI001E3FE195|nr:DapH/DapD/GlmU-related protein [Agrilactobacillus fermenti]MCD2255629.1 sugar O-acetyltransferase [Agrilactobacillus fermenti]
MKILKRALQGDLLKFADPEFRKIDQIVAMNGQRLQSLNCQVRTASDQRQLLGQIMAQPLPASSSIQLPFYTDFGPHIFVGEAVFINRDCLFVDLGGIYLADGVLIGPRTTILTVNHSESKITRRDIQCRPVHIAENAWIGANVTILPGVTIHENAIVGAGSVVTKDIPADSVVVGTPAKVIRKIAES